MTGRTDARRLRVCTAEARKRTLPHYRYGRSPKVTSTRLSRGHPCCVEPRTADVMRDVNPLRGSRGAHRPMPGPARSPRRQAPRVLAALPPDAVARRHGLRHRARGLGRAGGRAGWSCSLAAVLSGQLSIGWLNDYVDRDIDRAAGRADKPLGPGRRVERPGAGRCRCGRPGRGRGGLRRHLIGPGLAARAAPSGGRGLGVLLRPPAQVDGGRAGCRSRCPSACCPRS